MKTFSKKPAEGERSASIGCPCCGSEDFSPHWDADQGRWVRCDRCGLVLQNPQPLAEDVLERYDGEYFGYETENEEAFLKLMLLGLADIRFFDWGEKARRDNGDDGSFLDIGCATGRLGSWLNDRGWEARGVEVCREAAAWGNERYNITIHPGTLEDAAFPDESFRFVHSSHVIEHLNRPDEFISELYRILKPGGYCLCATPNSSGFQARLFAERWRSVIADHLFLFSRKTLRRLAESRGFAHERTRTWGGLGAGYAPVPVKRAVDRLVKPLGWGDVMLMVFRKPL